MARPLAGAIRRTLLIINIANVDPPQPSKILYWCWLAVLVFDLHIIQMKSLNMLLPPWKWETDIAEIFRSNFLSIKSKCLRVCSHSECEGTTDLCTGELDTEIQVGVWGGGLCVCVQVCGHHCSCSLHQKWVLNVIFQSDVASFSEGTQSDCRRTVVNVKTKLQCWPSVSVIATLDLLRTQLIAMLFLQSKSVNDGLVFKSFQ